MNNLLLKLRELKLRPIPTALGICFAILLFLIFYSGLIGQWTLEDIRLKSSDSTLAYMRRLELAIEIREAAADTISRARFYRAYKRLGIPGPVYRLELSRTERRLLKLLDDGGKLWMAHQDALPPEEIEAWRNLESVAYEFWNLLKMEEEGEKSGSEAPETNAQAIAGNSNSQKDTSLKDTSLKDTSPKDVNPNSDPNSNLGDDFFERRTNLERAATKLSEIIKDGLRDSQVYVDKQSDKAGSFYNSVNWFTLLMSIPVIGFTIWLTKSYINQVKQEERLKQEARGQLRSVFDSLSNTIVVLGEQGEVLEVNRAFLKHFEVKDAELKLQDYHAVLAQIPEIASFIEKTLQKQDFGQPQRQRIEVKSNNGHQKSNLFDVSVSPLKVGNRTNGRVVVMDDVTEEERVREELRRSRTLSAVGQITAQVAHEIYNPLGAIKLNLELLEMQTGADEDVGHTIGRLKLGVEHLSTIIMDLRYLTRPREPERKPTDLNRLLDEVVDLASDRLERSRISVTRDYSKEAPRGEFDPQQLRKVFLNLLINAVEASPNNGQVELQTRFISEQEAATIPDLNSSNGAIVVRVVDHGVGMSAETMRRLFEAFYTTKRNGTGLGMMITQEIVKKHGGKIEVKSEEGKGTTVNVYLPT
jgi:PAS domain S-box-containing protein